MNKLNSTLCEDVYTTVTTLSLYKNTTDAKLVKTSLSAGVFVRVPCGIYILAELCFDYLMKINEHYTALQATSNATQGK